MQKELWNTFLEDFATAKWHICEEIVAVRYSFSFWWPTLGNLENFNPLSWLCNELTSKKDYVLNYHQLSHWISLQNCKLQRKQHYKSLFMLAFFFLRSSPTSLKDFEPLHYLDPTYPLLSHLFCSLKLAILNVFLNVILYSCQLYKHKCRITSLTVAY